MRIVVGSTSVHKIEAVRSALLDLGIKADVVGVKAVSRVDEQPVGVTMIVCGATNRYEHARNLAPDADMWIGMESGLLRGQLLWFDITAVILRDKEERECAGMGGGHCWNVNDVLVAKKAGFATTTAGSALASRTGCDGTDPTAYVTGGAVRRSDLLAQAVKIALADWQRQTA